MNFNIHLGYNTIIIGQPFNSSNFHFPSECLFQTAGNALVTKFLTPNQSVVV
ncbi:hypothetical protein N9P53_01780 [Flavobacteriaceae bacterium]|nr:hypothetical protein [Flavobacteriaceae bacterium]